MRLKINWGIVCPANRFPLAIKIRQWVEKLCVSQGFKKRVESDEGSDGKDFDYCLGDWLSIRNSHSIGMAGRQSCKRTITIALSEYVSIARGE